ncbi:MAG: ABC transporter ATP-binding protein [Chloroflexota bacterium]|nr:MAG: ABC transporter ATP-binding protein [Chloroflexota bacterium]
MLASAKIIVQIAGQSPAEFLLSEPLVKIGRDSKNDIVIPDPYVSGEHIHLEQVGATYRLIHKSKTNPTTVNGQRIPDQILLQSGDTIRIGDAFGNSTGLIFQSSGGAQLRAPIALRLQKPLTNIGSAQTNDLVLHDTFVSGHHATVQQQGQQHLLTDVGSTNGTYVNGIRLTPRNPYALHPNDLIQIGSYQFRYDRRGLSSSTVLGMRLDGEDLQVRGDRELILNHVSVTIEPGKFVCLVGASGAGKSTLLNAISGFKRAQGTVWVNGNDLYKQYDTFRARIGYVPQDDILHKNMPVRRALRYAAEMRLPPNTDIEARIDHVLNVVELKEREANPISKLSGGQRKRASIAVELLAEPGLFFLDEPTSGLDPGLEKKMMKQMRELADSGKTVVLVTHATQNITLCDYVAFMAKGRLVFFGRPDEAQRFFGQQDFADIYQELSADPKNPDRVAQLWEGKFKQSQYFTQYVKISPALHPAQTPPPPARPKPPFWKQWWILTRRQFDLIARDKLTLFILLAVLPIIGFLIWQIVQPDVLLGSRVDEIAEDARYTPAWDAQTLLFIMGLAATLLGIFAASYEIVREQAIFKRERMVNLALAPYILSKVFVLCLFALVQAALFLGIVALHVPLPDKGALFPAWFEMYVTLVIAITASIALGLFISAAARTENMVIYIILLVLFVQILFAGVIFPLEGSAKTFSAVTLTHWTIDALGSTADLPTLRTEKSRLPKPDVNGCSPTLPPVQLAASDLPCMFPNPKDAKREKPNPKDLGELNIAYKHEPMHVFSRWLILLLFAGTFFGLTLAALKAKDEPTWGERSKKWLQRKLGLLQNVPTP